MLAFVLQSPLPTLDFVERWSYSIPKEFQRSVAAIDVQGNRLFYIEEAFRKKQAYGCLDLATGKSIWRTAGPVSTATYLSHSLKYFVASTATAVLQLDRNTGRMIWSIPREIYCANPVVIGDRVVFEIKKGTLVSIDLKTHREAWRKKFPFGLTPGFSETIGLGKDVIAATTDGSVLAVDAQTGRIHWKVPTGTGEARDFLPGPGTLAVAGNGLTLLNAQTGAKIWKRSDLNALSLEYHPEQNQLWVGRDDSLLYRISTLDGSSLGKESMLPGVFNSNGSVRYQDGYLLAVRRSILRLDRQGKPVSMFDPQDDMSQIVAVGSDFVASTATVSSAIAPVRQNSPPIPPR